jgi:TatD DNase family protein
MIDSHCHLADEVFEPDLEQVIRRAQNAGVTEVLCVIEASDPVEHLRLARVKALWPGVRTAAGVHPHRAGASDPALALRLVKERMRADLSVCAIGEIGLDYHYDVAPRDLQRTVFAAQVELARETGVPIIIHTREADADTFSILDEVGREQVRGVFHCFSGDEALARRAVSSGFHVSFSGIVTFPNATAIRAASRIVPPDRILAETDSPYLAPVPRRGTRNEPALVRHVIEGLAALRGIEADEMVSAISENFRALFGAGRGERPENALQTERPAR